MDIIAKISEELNIKRGQTEAAVKLIDEGNTIPFIARYRKEATGALNDEVLRTLFDRLNYLLSQPILQDFNLKSKSGELELFDMKIRKYPVSVRLSFRLWDESQFLV